MNVNFLSHVSSSVETGAREGFPWRPITETITNGFFTIDHKWKVEYWNKAAEKILGVRSADIIGKNIWEIFADYIPLNFYTSYHKAFRENTPIHFEEYWAEKGLWLDVIIFNYNQSLSVSFKSIIEPVINASSVHPLQQLKTLNEIYKLVTEITNDCLWEWNLVTSEIFWIDGGHKRVFGYPIENALIPQTFWESRLHPEDKERVLVNLNMMLTAGASSLWEDEYRFEKADGNYAYVHDRAHIIYEDGKKATRMIGATLDITARKTAEAQLLKTERMLGLIARQTASAVIITNIDQQITWVNSAFTRITEFELKEVMGKNPNTFLNGGKTNTATIKYLKQKMQDKQPFDCDIINYSKSGREYWVHIQGQPLFNENGECEQYFTLESDITDKVLLQDTLAGERLSRHTEMTKAVLAAQEKERNDIGKEMHDNVNQVLGAAKLYIEMARTDRKNRDACLNKSTKYIVNVIKQIRNISQTLSKPGLILGLVESIQNLLDDMTMVHPLVVEFHHQDIVEETLDENIQLNIFRIIQEQFNNIIKHSKANKATIDLVNKEGVIKLIISDNGRGCDLTKQTSGVGMINIKSRAELLGGSVDLFSNPGEGYEMQVLLPLKEVDNPALPALFHP
ncbi:MAG: PAS domain S-box protein [Flavitalea sp.]